MKQLIYNIKTGEVVTCDAVDARERVARGEWSMTMPSQNQPSAETKEPKVLTPRDLAVRDAVKPPTAPVEDVPDPTDEEAQVILKEMAAGTPISQMTVRQLRAVAKAQNKTIPQGSTKEQIIALLSV